MDGRIVTLILLISLCLGKFSGVVGDSYVVIAPKTIRPSMKLRISVNIFQASVDVQVKADLVAKNSVKSTVSRAVSPNSVTFIELQIPSQLPEENGVYSLRVTGSGGLSFTNETTLTVNRKCVSMFVQTDKGIYRPEQTVMMRFIGYKPTLLPYNGVVEVSITDPDSNLMAKWKDIQLVNGVASSEFPLSSEPPVGDWSIQVTGDCLSGSQTFVVDKYVLPKFEVTVNPPSFVLPNDASVSGTVTAKYTYGQPVKGTLILTFFLPTQFYDKKPKTLIKSGLKIDGTYAFQLDSTSIKNLQEDYYKQHSNSLPSWGQLAINASVTETLTGITLSGQGLTSFYSSSIKIKFHDSTPKTFKPGLTFVAWILVTTQDNKPVDGITVSVTPRSSFGSMSSVDIKVTAGLAKFTYDVHSSTTSLTIEATCQDSQTGTSVSAQQYLTMSQSPSRSFIQLTTTTSSAKIGMPLEYQVESTFPFSDLYYQVLGRGNVVMEGTKNLSIPSANTNLAIDVTHEMAPSAQILVYVIRNDGEVVVDSLTVSVVSAFKNEVNITFASLEKKPGDNVTVSITATPDSYVGVAAVDYSVALLADNNDITQSEVVDELQSYDTSKRPWNDDLGWEVNRKKRTVIYPWSPGGYDAYSIFDNAGILVMTDATIYRDKTRDYNYHRTIPACADCIAYFDGDREQASVLNAGIESKQPPQKGDLLEPQQVRTFFPETWLWANSITNANGLAEITSKVPDTITTWVASAFAFSNITGLGVPVDSAELKVFQPFFISLTLPYSVIRGEQLGLKVTVFNYLEENLENVSVELEENEDLIPVTYDVMTNEVNSISPAESLALSKSISISAKNGATVVFAVTPKRVGTIAIKVKAQSSNYRAADAVERSLLVVPEGRPVDYTHNVFIQLDQSDDALQQSLSLALPSDVVPNSARAMISVTGDLLGPTLNNLEQLVRMPYGCGEQNAASTAPNIFARQYLESTQQLTIKLKEKTNKYMITGYQRELNYRHNDGSYSAWGGSDDSGSLWLTAFVMKLYALASYYVTIDSRQVELSTSWIAQQQSKTTGVFTSVGRLVDTYISGGLEGDTARTAFVLIALIEARNAPSVAVSSDVSNAITKAQSYLEGKLASTTDSYAICIVAYALTLSGSAKSSEAIAKLNSIAVKDGGSTHWTNADGQSKQSNTDDFLYYPYHAPSADIEMTGYALLAITATGNVANGLPVAKWLSQQRNSLGGWSSTQDTCVALEALATYAAAVHGEAGSLDIELTSAIDEQFIHILSVDSENALVLQQAEVPVGGNLDMVVNGTGTVLLQATVSYNVPMHQQSEPAYQLVVDVTEKNGGNNIIVTLCSTYMKNSDSGMVVVSSTLPSGFGVDDDAMQTYLNSQEDVERYDVSGNQVDLYLNQLVYKSRKCVQVTASRQYDVGAVQPVPAVVYSYYEPDLERESVLYAPSSMVGVTVCELCLCDEYCAGCDGYKKTIDCSVFGQSSSAMAISSCHIFMYILVVFITTLIALLK